MNMPGIAAFFPEPVDGVFYKLLTVNDDSGRHGVLIPATAYSFFPVIPVADPGANPSVPITTVWRVDGGWAAQSSRFVQYDRYPERRITALLPDQVNVNEALRLIVVGRAREDNARFYCRVFSPRDPEWSATLLLLGIPAASVRPGGATGVLSAGELGPSAPTPFDDLLVRLQDIAARGPIKSLRSGDTGIGYTLETLLGIPANVSQGGGDYLGIELKTTRSRLPFDRRGKSAGNVTLFAKTPNWGRNGDRVGLLLNHGAPDKDGRFGMYMSVHARRPNPSGWELVTDNESRRVVASRYGAAEVWWDYEELQNRITEKHAESAFVTAFTVRGVEVETFLFDHVLHCSGPSLENFLKMLSDRHAFFDFAMHRRPDGSVRDHGFLFRTQQQFVPLLFETVESFRLA